MANFAKLSEAEEAEYALMKQTFTSYFLYAVGGYMKAEEPFIRHRAEQAAIAVVDSIRTIEKYNARHQ